MPWHIAIAGAPLASARGVGSTIHRMWKEPSKLTLYWVEVADTTVRVRGPEAAGPSVCRLLDEELTSYVHESPVCHVGASKAVGCGPGPAPGVLGFAPGLERFRRPAGPKATAAIASAATRAATMTARTFLCIPLPRCLGGRMSGWDIWALLDGYETLS